MPVETRTIQQAFKFALDPTPTQVRALNSHVGGARAAYNWGLSKVAEALDAYAAEKAAGAEKPVTKIPGHFDLCKLWTANKDAHADEPDDSGRTWQWVGENFVGSYQAALRDADRAWKNFFASRSGKRAGRRMGRPRFKSRHKSRRAFQVHGGTLQVVTSHAVHDTRAWSRTVRQPTAHYVKLPKIGEVKTHESTRKLLRRLRKDEARIVRGTVSQDSAGRWHIALTVELQREVRIGPSERQRTGGAVGVDLGVRDVVTVSNGQRFEAPRHLLKAQSVLRRRNKALARCEKDSAGRAKARRALGRVHNRVANLRLDFTQKMTSQLVHGHDKIAVEGWDVQETAHRGSPEVPKVVRRKRNLALADAGVGNARWQLKSKSVWYGSTVVETSQHAPTGRTCSACGQVRAKPVSPADEQFYCPACDRRIDRRLNTARVLASVAAMTVAPSGGETLNAGGGDVSLPAPRRGEQSPSKPVARARPPGRGRSGTSGP
jgi:putative transposase